MPHTDKVKRDRNMMIRQMIRQDHSTIYVSRDLHRTLQLYALRAYQKFSCEVSGFGRVKVDPGGRTTQIVDINIFPQDGEMVSTTLLGENVEKFYAALSEKEQKEWSVWWHTHPRMSTLRSTVDVETANELVSTTGRHWISLVVNDEGEMSAYLDGLVGGIRFSTKLEVKVVDDLSPEEIEAIDLVLEKNVTKKAWWTPCNSSSRWDEQVFPSPLLDYLSFEKERKWKRK